jgi:hypothetical protein
MGGGYGIGSSLLNFTLNKNLQYYFGTIFFPKLLFIKMFGIFFVIQMNYKANLSKTYVKSKHF